jgi:hypothetical protein
MLRKCPARLHRNQAKLRSLALTLREAKDELHTAQMTPAVSDLFRVPDDEAARRRRDGQACHQDAPSFVDSPGLCGIGRVLTAGMIGV